MHIIITGSLGNISKPLTQKLVQAEHAVTVISSNQNKAEEIQVLGAKAAIGSLEDVDFLSSTFQGADVVYTMTPNNFGAANQREYMAGVGKNYAQAIRKSGVKNVVNLSSIGADLPEGTGPIKGLYDVEKSLNGLENVNIKHLRAGYFYINFYNDIPMIKNLGFMGSNFGADTLVPLVYPADIANEVAKQIEAGFEGKSVRYVYSDEQKASAIAAILGKAVGKPELAWVQFASDQALQGMLQAGLPEPVAKNYVEMGEALGSGLLSKDFNLHKTEAGTTSFEVFSKEFAQKF